MTESKTILTLGTIAHKIDLNDHKIVDDATGRSIDPSKVDVFNPAILRLSPGSAWGFVAVLRASQVLQVRNQTIIDDRIIAIGLDVKEDSQFYAITDGLLLDISNPTPWEKGINDPRLFYTDIGTPAMTFVKTVYHHDHNHGGTMFFVEDLRDLFPALDPAMATSVRIPPRISERPLGWKAARELIRTKGMQKMWEKNWLSFFPSAEPDGISTIPHFIYRSSPFQALSPDTPTSTHSIDFIDLPSAPEVDLIVQKHPDLVKRGTAEVRGSAGIIRLTLCQRSDTAVDVTEENTVGLGILHVREGQVYHHFFVLYSLEAPCSPVSVGPQFQLGKFDLLNIRSGEAEGITDVDDGSLLFISSITAIPAVVPENVAARPNLLPDHCFLDDSLVIGFGREDREAMTVTVKVSEVMKGLNL